MLSTYFKVSGVKAITNMENYYSKKYSNPGNHSLQKLDTAVYQLPLP